MPIDYKKYPPNWKTEIRPRILERDGHRCKHCNVPNYAVIFRGYLDGKEVYQDIDANIYDAGNSELLYAEDFYQGIEPLNGDPNSQAIKIILTIAHLDHDITNNDDDNLTALCQKCHLSHDIKDKMRSRREKLKKAMGLQDLFKVK